MSEDLKQSISENGWRMEPPGFIPFDLKTATAEFEKAYANGVVESSYENVAVLYAQDIAALPEISSILDHVRKHMRVISPALKFEKLWLVSTKAENINPTVVPFVPHIDKRRYLKAMIYLEDVGDQDGPFTVADYPPAKTDALRATFTPDYKERRQNVIEFLPAAAYKPCGGPAGSVIFFDTNGPHYAGHVRGIGKRRVFRFDFTVPSWNPVPVRVRLAQVSRRALNMFGRAGKR